jgi:hypothetical protein
LKLTLVLENTYFLRRISHETCEAKYNKFGKKEEKEIDSFITDRTRTRSENDELFRGSCLKCKHYVLKCAHDFKLPKIKANRDCIKKVVIELLKKYIAVESLLI